MKTLLVTVLKFVLLSGCGSQILDDQGLDSKSIEEVAGMSESTVIGSREWQKATAPGKYNWSNAISYCSSLNLSGKSDWRLPSKDELSSVIDTSVSSPKIVAELRDTTESSYYWSSTSGVNGTSNAWYVVFVHGFVYNHHNPSSYYVRCVRGG